MLKNSLNLIKQPTMLFGLFFLLLITILVLPLNPNLKNPFIYISVFIVLLIYNFTYSNFINLKKLKIYSIVGILLMSSFIYFFFISFINVKTYSCNAGSIVSAPVFGGSTEYYKNTIFLEKPLATGSSDIIYISQPEYTFYKSHSDCFSNIVTIYQPSSDISQQCIITKNESLYQ